MKNRQKRIFILLSLFSYPENIVSVNHKYPKDSSCVSFLPAEKRQDALPNSCDHKLPGSLHLHGGSAHSLLPLLVFEVSVGLTATSLLIILKTSLM